MRALGSKITVQESPWNCSIQVTMNQQKKPFDGKRVHRALTLALDRWEGSKALSRIAVVKDVAGIQVPGTPWTTPPDELDKLAGCTVAIISGVPGVGPAARGRPSRAWAWT